MHYPIHNKTIDKNTIDNIMKLTLTEVRSLLVRLPDFKSGVGR